MIEVPYLKPDFSNRAEVDQALIINKCIELGSRNPKERTMNVNPNNPTPAQVDKFLRDDADFFDALKVSADANGEPVAAAVAIHDDGAAIGLEPIYVTTDEGEEDKPTVH